MRDSSMNSMVYRTVSSTPPFVLVFARDVTSDY